MHGHTKPHLTDQPFGQLPDDFIAVCGIDHIRRGGAVDRIACLDGRAGHAARDRRGQRIGAAAAMAAHHAQDTRLFRYVRIALGGDGARLVRAGWSDDALPAELRQARRIGLRNARTRMGAGEVRAERQHFATGDGCKRLSLPHAVAFHHIRPGDDTGEGRGHRHAGVGWRLDHRWNSDERGFLGNGRGG